MECEECKTEFTGETCPNCGYKIQKMKCIDCGKQFYKSYLKSGLCPECYEIELNAPYKNPLLAGILSIIPGLGYRYLGLKFKSGICIIIFFFLFTISMFFPVLFLVLFIVIISQMIGAYFKAKVMNSRE